jgi:hypothetical protein
MKVRNKLFWVLNFLPGKLFYGPGLMDYVSSIMVSRLHVEIELPTGWVNITPKNWRLRIVKGSPVESRALINGLHAALPADNNDIPDLLVYGTKDDWSFRDIEELPCYPPLNDCILSLGQNRFTLEAPAIASYVVAYLIKTLIG